MKKLKHKILLSTIASVSTITILAPLCSCVNISKENDNDVVKHTSSLNAIAYTTIKYEGDSGSTVTPSGTEKWNVTLNGQTVAKAREGVIFGSIPRPKATHSLNWKFLGWSTVKGDATKIVSEETVVPKASVEKWTLYPIFETPALLSNCLCVSAIEDTKVTINFQATPTNSSNRTFVDMSYSTDFGTTWTPIEYTLASPTFSVDLAAGASLYLKGDNPLGLSTAADNYTHFSFTKPVNLFGNAMGLVNNGSRETQKNKAVPNAFCFYHLFENQTNIEYVADNFFPCEKYAGGEAATLKASCYEGAFIGCSGMVHCPRLFASTLAVNGSTDNPTTNCYKDIFNGCSNVDFVRIRYDSTYDSTKFDGWVNGVKSTGTFIFDGDSAATASFKAKFPSSGAGWTLAQCPDDTIYDVESQQITFSDIDFPEDFPTNCTADHKYELTATVTKGGVESSSVLKDVYWASGDETIATIDHVTGTFTGVPFIGTEPKKVLIYCFSKANLNAYNYKLVTVNPIVLGNCTSVKNPSITDSVKISWTFVGQAPESGYPNIKYTLNNGQTWLESTKDLEIEIPANTTIYLKGDNPKGLSAGVEESYTQFVTTGKIELGGTVVGLINNGLPTTGNEVIPCDYCFSHLFSGSNVSKVAEGYLPYKAGQITKYCYENMFSFCDNLTTIPTNLLPAEALTDKDGNDADGCYSWMFYKSGSLNVTPTLPATTISKECYYRMFYGTGITETPELKATAGKVRCYMMMFQDCQSVTKIRPLSLTSLADECCFQMFSSINWAYNNYHTTSGTGRVLIWTVPSTTGITNPTMRFVYRDYDSAQKTPTAGTTIYITETL